MCPEPHFDVIKQLREVGLEMLRIERETKQ